MDENPYESPTSLPEWRQEPSEIPSELPNLGRWAALVAVLAAMFAIDWFRPRAGWAFEKIKARQVAT